MDFGKMTRDVRPKQEAADGDGEIDEYASAIAELKAMAATMAAEVGLPEETSEETSEAAEKGDPPAVSSSPSEPTERHQRGFLEASTLHPARREVMRRAVSIEAARVMFEVEQRDAKGNRLPPPTVSAMRDDIGRGIGVRIDFHGGGSVEDEGHRLTLYAADTDKPHDSVLASFLFDVADMLGRFDAWGSADAGGRPEWLDACYREAFHRSRPVLPAVNVAASHTQEKPALWLKAMRDLVAEYKAKAGTGIGDAALQRLTYMQQMVDKWDLPRRACVKAA